MRLSLSLSLLLLSVYPAADPLGTGKELVDNEIDSRVGSVSGRVGGIAPELGGRIDTRDVDSRRSLGRSVLARDSRWDCSTDGRDGGSSGTSSSILLSRLLSCTRESVIAGGVKRLLGTGADAERTVKGGGSRAGICGTVHCLSKLILESRCSRSDLSRSNAPTSTTEVARKGSGDVMT